MSLSCSDYRLTFTQRHRGKHQPVCRWIYHPNSCTGVFHSSVSLCVSGHQLGVSDLYGRRAGLRAVWSGVQR